RIMRHRVSGSFAIFADLFRYELLRRGAGMWIDCDLYCVRPFVFSGDHVFGRESADSVCNAALLLPADSPVLAGLIEPFGQVSPIPAWLPERVRGELQTAKAAGARFDMSHLP